MLLRMLLNGVFSCKYVQQTYCESLKEMFNFICGQECGLGRQSLISIGRRRECYYFTFGTLYNAPLDI